MGVASSEFCCSELDYQNRQRYSSIYVKIDPPPSDASQHWEPPPRAASQHQLRQSVEPQHNLQLVHHRGGASTSSFMAERTMRVGRGGVRGERRKKDGVFWGRIEKRVVPRGPTGVKSWAVSRSHVNSWHAQDLADFG